MENKVRAFTTHRAAALGSEHGEERKGRESEGGCREEQALEESVKKEMLTLYGRVRGKMSASSVEPSKTMGKSVEDARDDEGW